jgi:hypothetical protein
LDAACIHNECLIRERQQVSFVRYHDDCFSHGFELL